MKYFSKKQKKKTVQKLKGGSNVNFFGLCFCDCGLFKNQLYSDINMYEKRTDGKRGLEFIERYWIFDRSNLIFFYKYKGKVPKV